MSGYLHAPAAVPPPGKNPVIYGIAWMGPRAGLNGFDEG